jgi:predicted kinase
LHQKYAEKGVKHLLTAISASVPTLVIIAGLPATGKTTLARCLADHLALPLMQKDMIKESLYNVLGCDDIETSLRLGHVSMVLLYRFAEAVLKTGQSCLIESTFSPRLATRDLLSLQQRCPFSPLQIYCRTEPAVLAARWKRRMLLGERHPGHMESQRRYNSDAPIPGELLQPLPLAGHLIELDTTSFEKIDYEKLFSQIDTIIG